MTDRELMQRALDALDGYARNCRCEGGGAPCDAAEALRARLAQPDLITHADVEQLARIEKLVEDVDPYTAPPQREWQGLTDDEIESTIDEIAIDAEDKVLYPMGSFAHAIEAKLKQKNAL